MTIIFRNQNSRHLLNKIFKIKTTYTQLRDGID